MSKKIIINVADHETRVALVEDETIVELFIERKGSRDNTGNIYKGRVQRVLPGMQAAFVDIGLNQAAFIYVDDVVRDNYADIEGHFICNDVEEDDLKDGVDYFVVTSTLDDGEYDSLSINEVSRNFEFD